MKIPEYEAQSTGIQLGPVPRATDYARDERVGSLAPGLSAIARGLEGLATGQQYQADALQRSEDQQAMTRAALQVSALHAGITQDLFTRHQQIFSGAYPDRFDGLVPEFAKKVDDLTGKALEGVTNPKAQSYIQTQMAHIRDAVVLPKTLATEATARDQLTQYNMTGMVANSAQIADTTPDVYPVLRESVTTAIRNSGLPFERQNNLLHHAQVELTKAALNAQVQATFRDFIRIPTGPVAERVPGVGEPPLGTVAMPLVAGPLQDAGPGIQTAALTPAVPEGKPPTDAALSAKYPAWADATPELRDQIRRRAQVLSDQADAQQVGGFAAAVKDQTAIAQQGIPARAPFTKQDFERIYGADPAEWAVYDHWQSVAHIGQNLRTMTNTQIEQAVADMKPQGDVALAAQRWAAWNSLYKDASAELSAREKLAAGILQNRAAGQMALLKNGQSPGPLMDKAEFEAAGLASAHGAYSAAIATQAAIAGISNLSMPEAQALALQPLSGDPATAVAEGQRQTALRQAVTQDFKLRADDPQQYVLDTDPVLAAQRAAALGKDGTPAQMAAYLQAVVSRQEQRMPGWAPQLLTKADQQNLSARFNTNTAGYGSPDEQVKSWRQTVSQYGARFGEVIAEYKGKGGKMPPEVEYFNWMEDGRGTYALDQSHAAQLATIKEADMEKSLGKAGVTGKQIAAASSAALHDIKVGLTDNPANETLFNAINSVVTKKTASFVSHGMDLTDAVQRAAAPALARVKVFPQGAGNPGMMIPADANPDLVREGARLALTQIKAADLMVPPTGIVEKGAGPEQYLGRVLQNPVWISDGSTLGLYTTDQYNGLVRVRRADGRPLTYTYNDLRFMAGEFTGVPRVDERANKNVFGIRRP